LQQATPPTTAALLPHPSQGEHQLVLTALDPALVCHQAVANVVYDTVAPTVTVTSDAAARLRLGGVDVTSGIAAWDVSARDDTGKLVYYKVSSDRTRTLSAVKPGGRYTVRVLAHDRAGNTSSPRTLVVTLARDDTSFTKVGPWSRSARTGDYGGTHLASGKPGTALTLTTTTRRLDGYFLTGPNEGYVDVLMDGRRTARLDLYAARSGVARPVLAQWPTVGLHTVRLVATGSHRAKSSGSSVLVDGLLALR
ncbi:MAG: hypothetical protein JWO12_2557, partial [Frankiales bacterium]|nr:hypothetical protein [Frankiales bacterium]